MYTRHLCTTARREAEELGQFGIAKIADMPTALEKLTWLAQAVRRGGP
jgi:hypothetical protein